MYNIFKLPVSNKSDFCHLYFLYRQYKTLSFKQINTGDNKHYSPANKEWNNSIYTYNHIHTVDLPFKDEISNRLLRSYLNLIPFPKDKTKSKRMRNLITRSATKRLFISKPDIKQTSNKAIITVYTFNREKQFINSKLHELFVELQKFLNKSVLGPFYSEEISFFTDIDMYKERLNFYMLKKRSRLIKIFFFKFLRWVLSMFDLKVEILSPKNKKGISLIREAKKIKIKNSKLSIVFNFKRPIWLNIDCNFDIINVVLLTYLFKYLKMTYFIPKNINNIIYKLFIIFRMKYHNKFMKRLLKVELSTLNYIITIFLYKHKFVNYLSILRTFLKKIYNKKIELNLVDLKYLHLNSDIYSEAIATKLKKKKSVLTKVLKNSISLVKIPIIKPIKVINNNIMSNLFTSNQLNYNCHSDNKDVIYILLTEMFKFKKIHKSDLFKEIKQISKHPWKTNIEYIMNFLKYKWTTGVRIEAKGRLTQRYTASRAVFFYKYKGSLKNLEHLMDLKNLNLKKQDNLQRSPTIHMLRGEVKPNLQHTFISSKKRIGAFGINGWISNN